MRHTWAVAFIDINHKPALLLGWLFFLISENRHSF
jgi:hypothetical protein